MKNISQTIYGLILLNSLKRRYYKIFEDALARKAILDANKINQ